MILFSNDYKEGTGAKRFILYNKNNINNVLKTNNNLYEVLTDNKIYKLYIDIETENK